MLKPLKQHGYIILNDKEIMFIIGRPEIETTTYLTIQARYASIYKKVLFFEYDTSKETLIEKCNYLDNDNVVIIDDHKLAVEDMEQYIKEYKPEYIYIDYFHLINSKEKPSNEDKDKFILDVLDRYVDKYNVKIMITDRYGSKKDDEKIYLSDTYDRVNSIWILKEDTMTRIK